MRINVPTLWKRKRHIIPLHNLPTYPAHNRAIHMVAERHLICEPAETWITYWAIDVLGISMGVIVARR